MHVHTFCESNKPVLIAVVPSDKLHCHTHDSNKRPVSLKPERRHFGIKPDIK